MTSDSWALSLSLCKYLHEDDAAMSVFVSVPIRSYHTPFPIFMLPVSCIVRCLIIVSILHWIQKMVHRGNLFHRGKPFGRNIIWLLSCSWVEGTRVTVNIISSTYNSLILSFCGNLSFRSVFIVDSYFRLLLMRFFLVVVFIIIQQRNLLSSSSLNSMLIRIAFFWIISDIRYHRFVTHHFI